uniref:Secreted protein n=1 Tax=Globodera pallida TaxID=36090 RepID=A0A183BNN1_GLOPA
MKTKLAFICIAMTMRTMTPGRVVPQLNSPLSRSVVKKILNAMTKDDFAWKNYFKNRSEEDKLGSGALTELKERHNELEALDEGGV